MSLRKILIGLAAGIVVLAGLYLWLMLSWSYSSGERAGYVQKLSSKGWLCKTWEGEMAMVSMPGAVPEKFYFTVHDDKVAEDITRHLGKRVRLHYEEKAGLPTSCFGDTRHFITEVTPIEEIPLAPGVTASAPSPAAPAPAK